MGSPLIFLTKQAVTLCIVEISGKRMMGRGSENEGNSGWRIEQQHGKECVDRTVGQSRRPSGDICEMPPRLCVFLQTHSVFTSVDAEF